MKDYAVIKIDHKQYIVEPDKTYTVDKFVAEEGDKLTPTILAVSKDDKLTIDPKSLEKIQVEIEVIEQGKGDKVVTKTYKAKSRYRRTRGHRKRVTTFKVLNIK